MLRWRLLLGTLFIAVLVALCWLDARTDWRLPPLFLLALVLTVLASAEVLWLLSAQNLRPLPWVVYLGNLLVVASNAIPLFWFPDERHSPLHGLGWPLAALAIGLIVAFAGEMARYEKPGGAMVNLGLAVFGLAYVGVLFSFVVHLRMVGGRQWGLIALLSLVTVVKLSDIGAYAVGRIFGRHKMSPRLSPGKTWEGAAGGVLFGILGSWLILELLTPRLIEPLPLTQPWGWLVYGVLVSIAGMVGDLAESLFKRDVGRKDSSAWMPGFGGVLDLLDSILLAAPVAYFCWIAGLVGPG